MKKVKIGNVIVNLDKVTAIKPAYDRISISGETINTEIHFDYGHMVLCDQTLEQIDETLNDYLSKPL